MLSKKALLLEALVRLVPVAILIFVFMSCSVEMYGFFFGSKATRDFNNLVNFIKELDYDEQQKWYLHLGVNNAIIAFTKDSEKIEFEGKQSKYLTLKSYLNRPSLDSCKEDTACLCLCKGEFITKNIPELKCSVKLKCESFDNLNFLKTINEKDLGITDFFESYNFKNGFFIKRVELTEREKRMDFYPAQVPTFTYSPVEIYIKKDKDTNIVRMSTKSFEAS